MTRTRAAVLVLLVVLAALAGCTSSRPSPKPPPPIGAPASPGVPSIARWHPTPGLAWQWQLSVPVDQSVNVPIYDIDGFENSAAVVAALHAKGRKVICYIDVGAAEDFRPDYKSFPATVLGRTSGWKGERWLDVRRLDLLGPIIGKRFDMCRTKGFDAVEADVMDHFTNTTGFSITAADQLRFARFIAGLAHARGLAVGLKNNPEQVAQLVKDFDFAVVEECAEYDECSEYSPFVAAGKAVLHTEYSTPNAKFCPITKPLHFSSMRKNLRLDAPRWPCPAAP